VIAVDTNLLIYAHREESPWHEPASAHLRQLAEGRGSWGIPWPCIHEFFSIATHPRIYEPPSPRSVALEQVDAWLESPTLVVLTEADDHWQRLRALIEKGRVEGPKVHDARIAAICLEHGVRELWTADRDFGRFPDLRTRNPLV
jgi:toxin-antitoxin system PIN domain toxin